MTDGTDTGPGGPPHPRQPVQKLRPRSRADRFAALVEETGTGRHHRRPTDGDTELLALVGVAHRLGQVPTPTVSAQFRDDLHARLLAEVAQQSATQPAAIPAARRAVEGARPTRDLAAERTQVVRQVQPRRGGRTRLAVLIGLATGAIAISGVSMASNGSVPGDPLYSFKRSGEQAQLVLAGSDANRGQLHLDFARTRLVEARQVAPEAVGGVLAEMDWEITEGARLLFSAGVQGADVGPIDSVAAFIAAHRADLLDLRATVSAADEPARSSLDLLDTVEVRANELRAVVVGGCTVVSADRFGPKPAC